MALGAAPASAWHARVGGGWFGWGGRREWACGGRVAGRWCSTAPQPGADFSVLHYFFLLK